MSEFQVGEGQIKVIVNPDDQKNEVDNIRLHLTSVEGHEKVIDFTPDEALEVSALLTQAVQFWLLESDEYADILSKRLALAERRA